MGRFSKVRGTNIHLDECSRLDTTRLNGPNILLVQVVSQLGEPFSSWNQVCASITNTFCLWFNEVFSRYFGGLVMLGFSAVGIAQKNMQEKEIESLFVSNKLANFTAT